MGDLWIKGGTIVTADRMFAGDVVIRGGRIEMIVERGGEAAHANGRTRGADAPHFSAQDEGEPGRTGSDIRVSDRDEREADIRVSDRDGREADIRVLDATGKFVLPGLIDVHVHFREPGLTDKEDFSTGTLAAAAGGVTTVLDMPNTLPPVATADVLLEKAETVAGRAHVDYGFYALIDEHNLDELRPMAEAGASGFKLFLGPTTGDLRAPNWGRLLEVFETVRDIGLPLVIHAEDRDVIEYWTAKTEAALGSEETGGVGAVNGKLGKPFGKESKASTSSNRENAFDYAAFLATRPRFGEVAATQTACLLAQMTGTPIHIAHVALAEAVEVIRQAKAAGAPVTAETCPPYLTMTAADCKRLGAVSKILPPIRNAADREALWAGLHDGTIDLIATDHAPHEAEAKKGGWMAAAGGMLGVETMLPVLLDNVRRGRLTMHDLVEWTSGRPAEVFGLQRKGALRSGLDGDVVVVDMNEERTIAVGGGERVSAGKIGVPSDASETPDEAALPAEQVLRSKSGNTALVGETLTGAVVHTVVRGRIVVDNGRPTGEQAGEWMRSAPAPFG